jgi:hypothetical protein
LRTSSICGSTRTRFVAREWKFNYALDEVNTSANRFGEGGVINMVDREAREDIPAHRRA